MTTKPLHELTIGDDIADMHYGEAQLHERFDVISHIRWEEPREAPLDRDGYPVHAFFRYLEQFLRGRTYLNKYLYVIDFAADSTLTDPVFIAGYSYDGRRNGILTLRAQ